MYVIHHYIALLNCVMGLINNNKNSREVSWTPGLRVSITVNGYKCTTYVLVLELILIIIGANNINSLSCTYEGSRMILI